MTALARPRNNKIILLVTVALAIFAVLTAAAGYWWNERSKPSQASKADCVLAQRIINEAQQLPHNKAAVEKWEKSTMQLRRSQMKDGYLGFRIAQYELWVAMQAKGEGAPPESKEVDRLAKLANAHCADAGVKLALPPIAS